MGKLSDFLVICGMFPTLVLPDLNTTTEKLELKLELELELESKKLAAL